MVITCNSHLHQTIYSNVASFAQTTHTNSKRWTPRNYLLFLQSLVQSSHNGNATIQTCHATLHLRLSPSEKPFFFGYHQCNNRSSYSSVVFPPVCNSFVRCFLFSFTVPSGANLNSSDDFTVIDGVFMGWTADEPGDMDSKRMEVPLGRSPSQKQGQPLWTRQGAKTDWRFIGERQFEPPSCGVAAPNSILRDFLKRHRNGCWHGLNSTRDDLEQSIENKALP